MVLIFKIRTIQDLATRPPVIKVLHQEHIPRHLATQLPPAITVILLELLECNFSEKTRITQVQAIQVSVIEAISPEDPQELIPFLQLPSRSTRTAGNDYAGPDIRRATRDRDSHTRQFYYDDPQTTKYRNYGSSTQGQSDHDRHVRQTFYDLQEGVIQGQRLSDEIDSNRRRRYNDVRCYAFRESEASRRERLEARERSTYATYFDRARFPG